MSKKLNNECSKALSALVSRLESAEKFVVDQTPSICKEILIEKALDATMQVGGNLVIFVILASSSLFCFLKAPQENMWYIGVGVLGFLSVFAFELTYSSLGFLLTVKKCPKLVVLRELKSMIGRR